MKLWVCGPHQPPELHGLLPPISRVSSLACCWHSLVLVRRHTILQEQVGSWHNESFDLDHMGVRDVGLND